MEFMCLNFVTSGHQEGYDVYVYEAEPLEAGVEKHTLSVFVADEAGLINRVAGVFARRGANIESLAVGLNLDKALFTIVVNGTAVTVSNLVKQLSKLVKVRYVEDITKKKRIERELVLVKVKAPVGDARTEVLQLVNIFRARVIDVSDRTLTIAVSGDPGKTRAFEQLLTKFGIDELVRTGKICLKRGEELLEMGGWGDCIRQKQLAQQYQQRQQSAARPADDPPSPALANDSGWAGEEATELDADVYAVEDVSEGVWQVENVLEPVYDSDAKFEPYTLCLEVDNSPGVLQDVTGVVSRRGYNVQSLAVGPCEKEGRSRISMVIPGDAPSVQKLLKHIKKLVCIQEVKDLTNSPFAQRELMLVKVRCSVSQRVELQNLATMFRGNVCDISMNTITIQVEGKEGKLKSMTEMLEPYGILEVARTGKIAITRDMGLSTRYLEGVQASRVY
eukprot:evm.model.scf_875.5 EVM.evm.TU.scf_875.5   scf_875:49569-55537(+)